MKNNNFDRRDLSKIPLDESWSYVDKTIKDTLYITHGYYTYPAKFIPQIAERLIKENSEEGEIVVDPFMGSGTTIVEAIINKRFAIGVDINKIAYLITKVKTTPLSEKKLIDEYNRLEYDLFYRLNGKYDYYSRLSKKYIPQTQRIDYWFGLTQKQRLAIILQKINEQENANYRNFFLVAFAQILKSCSIWLQKSVKPTRHLDKKEVSPLDLFLMQAERMIRKNKKFRELFHEEASENILSYRKVQCRDARNLPCEDRQASLVVTSPPYVTSYEYADLHQLPSLWFRHIEELSDFRNKFIGSSFRERNIIALKSTTADNIVKKFGDCKKGREVRNYFADMLECFLEMKRVLKKDGKACIVIGNAQLRGINILNAEVFCEQFETIGFKIVDVIHREISSKMLPSTRDPKSGRFAKSTIKNKMMIHPKEYIIIAKKVQK